MKIAAALQSAFTAQKNRDLVRIIFDGDTHRCGVLTCERARFWRDRYQNAVDEIDELHGQLAKHGIRPARRWDGNEANYGPLTA